MNYKLFGSIGLLLSSIAMFIILPRSVGVQLYGQYSFILALFNLMLQISLLEVNKAYIFFASKNEFSRKQIDAFYFYYSFSCVVIVALITFFLLSFEIELLWPNLDNKIYVLLGLIICVCNFLLIRLTDVADAHLITNKSEIIKVAGKISLAVALFVLYLIGINDLSFFMILNFSISLVTLGLLSYFLKNYVYFFSISRKLLKSVMTYSGPLLGFTIISALWMMQGRVMLQSYGSSEQSGYFGLSHSLVMLISGIVSPSMLLLLKKLSEVDSLTEIKKIMVYESRILFLITSAVSIFLFINASEFIKFFVGENFILASDSLRWLAVFCYLNFFGMITSNIFNAKNMNGIYAKINSLVVTVSLLITGFAFGFGFIVLNAEVLAISFLLTYFARFAFQLIALKSVLKSLLDYTVIFYLIGVSSILMIAAIVLSWMDLNFLTILVIYGFIFLIIVFWKEIQRECK
jgi:O-antigen/teichoic acid export membrane protein